MMEKNLYHVIELKNSRYKPNLVQKNRHLFLMANILRILYIKKYYATPAKCQIVEGQFGIIIDFETILKIFGSMVSNHTNIFMIQIKNIF